MGTNFRRIGKEGENAADLWVGCLTSLRLLFLRAPYDVNTAKVERRALEFGDQSTTRSLRTMIHPACLRYCVEVLCRLAAVS